MQPAWTTTSQVNVNQGVKMLVHAGSGEGKTMLCATAPRPVIISAESGLLSLNKANIERVFGAGNPHVTYDIPVLQVTNVDQLISAYNYFATDQTARQHCGTICIDSLSEIAEVVLANAKRQVKDPRMAYGELIEKMLETVRKFRDLPGYNVYMTAKQEFIKDEATGIAKYMPSMPGAKLGQQLPYFFDEVFRLGTNKTPEGVQYRFLRTNVDLQYVAKDRSGRLGEIERPDLTHIISKIKGA